MKAKDVSIGKVYAVKVGEKIRPVRLDSVSRYGGWDATNLATSRTVRIRTAAKLRYPVEPILDKDGARVGWRRVTP